MENNREQLLKEISAYSEMLDEKKRLTAEITRLEAQNVKLKQELEAVPAKQSKYAEKAQSTVLDKAREQDKELNLKIDRFFMILTVLLGMINAAIVYFMADKSAVAGRTQMINMELFGDITAAELVDMYPFLLVLAVVFQLGAVAVAVYISNNVIIRKR